jgi:CheY-like chemotaxis protein
MTSGQQPRSCILIVEDDADLRDSLADLLTEEGYQVAGASNGQEALDYLRHAAPPCLILLDLMMPVMNGWEFCEQQQKDPALSTIPVAVVSGVRNALNRRATLNAVEYFQKPVDLTALLQTVALYC